MPFYKKINPLVFLILLCASNIAAQHFPTKHYTSSNVLPHNVVRSLFFDSQHVLWIGTDNGVLKKENDLFTAFYKEDGLAMNNTWAIAEDRLGHVWFGSYGAGLSVYDGQFFQKIDVDNGLVHNEITDFFVDDNLMYVGTSNGLSVVDIQSMEVRSYVPKKEKAFWRVHGFFKYKNTVYCSTYESGIFKLDTSNQQLIVEEIHATKRVYASHIQGDSLFVSRDKHVAKVGLNDYLITKDTLPQVKIPHAVIWDYQEIMDGRLLTAAWGIYETNGGLFEIVGNKQVPFYKKTGITSSHINALEYDPILQKLYVATGDQGLFEVDMRGEVLFESLSFDRITGIANTKNSQALLTDKGLAITYNETSVLVDLLQLKKAQQFFVNHKKRPLPVKKDSFYEINYDTKAVKIRSYDLKSHEDIYWLNTNIGMYQISERGKIQQYLPLHTEEFNFTSTGELIETDPYLGTRIHHNLDAFDYTYYNHLHKNNPWMVVGSLQKGDVTYLQSVFQGLYTYKNGKFTSYVKEGFWAEKKLRHSTTLGDDLVFSNEFGTVFIVNDSRDFKVKKTIPRAETKGNTISFLKEYQGRLLVGTEKGLTVFDGDRRLFIDQEQGLKQPFYAARVAGDTLEIASDKGVFKVNLKQVLSYTSPLDSVNVSEILINNKPISLWEMNALETLELDYDQNTLLLKYGVSNHPYPGKLTYQYRLQQKGDWSVPSKSSSIFLPYLPAQRYAIQVKVTDESTGTSIQKSLLQVHIKAPYYATVWFKLLLLILVGVIGFAVYKYKWSQEEKLQKQKRISQKRLEESKMESLLAQMNPHFTFNAMNSIQNYILDNKVSSALLFLGSYSKLIRLNLEYCSKRYILLVEEINYLKLYAKVENERFNDRVNVTFEIDEDLDEYDIEVPAMLLQPFVENVFVHAFPPSIRQPALTISFRLKNESLLECIVADNGVGVSETSTKKRHNSKGISIVKERLKLLDFAVEDVLQVITAENEGFKVVFELEV